MKSTRRWWRQRVVRLIAEKVVVNPFPPSETERPLGFSRALGRTVAQPPEAMRVASRCSSPSSRSHAQSVVMRTTARDLPAEDQHLTDAGGESETATSNPFNATLEIQRRARLSAPYIRPA